MSDSMITKRAIASGLKELTRKKSFDKIKISDITEYCGLNRQTFYYHFHDKYELADWIYDQDIISNIMDHLTYDNWDQKVLMMLAKMKSESYFYETTLKLSVENGFRSNLFRITTELFGIIFDRIASDLQKNSIVSTEEKKFICEFYAFGMVGIIISWAQLGMKESPEKICDHLKSLYMGTHQFIASRIQGVPEHKE